MTDGSLYDSKLAMLPDPAELVVVAPGGLYKTRKDTDFYAKYTVGYWKFNEGVGRNGTLTFDESLYYNHGVMLNFDDTDVKDHCLKAVAC